MQNKPEKIDLYFYYAKFIVPIWEHKLIISFCTLLGLSISIPISLLTHPEYTSTAIVQVEEPRAKMVSEVTEKITANKGEGAYILAEAEKMLSAGFLVEVLKVIPDRLKDDLQVPMKLPDQIIGNLQNFIKKDSTKAEDNTQDNNPVTPERLKLLSDRISVNSQERRGMIRIEAKTFDRDMAPVLVKSYIDVWTALNMEENKRQIRHELDFTRDQRLDYLQKSKKAGNELKLFKQKYEIPPAVKSVTDTELQSQLDILQNKAENTKERYKRLDDIYLELNRKEKSVVNNIVLINPPQPPLSPSKNLRIPIVLIGTLLGSLLGIAPILIWDYYRGSIRHEKDITSIVKIPIIGKLPNIT